MKAKEKLVKKYLPVKPFDMAGLEQWLSAMAARGLYVQTLNETQAKFRPGPAKSGVRYALDVAGPCDIDHERNEAYAQMGWAYTATLKGMYYVYQTEDPDAPELHTDPVTQSGTLTPLIRRRWRRMVYLLILFAILIRGTLVDLFTDPWSLVELFLVNTWSAVIYYLMVLIYIFVTVFHGLGEIRSLGKLRRQLAAGIPLDGERRWPRRLPPPVMDVFLYVALVAGMLAAILGRSQSIPLDSPQAEQFPRITIEQSVEGGLPADEVVWRDAWSRGTLQRSLLCPEQYLWSDRATAICDGNAVECGITLSCTRVRDEALAPLMLRCRMESERTWWREYEDTDISINPELILYQDFRPVSYPGLDELQVMVWQTDHMDAPRAFYAGRLGDRVVTLTCWGLPDEELCLELLAQGLTEL